ncbi:MAG TPA: hypothetical protein VEU33_05560 [Archangium sp.]|nr:hypothetical protein [Archangium sp.]
MRQLFDTAGVGWALKEGAETEARRYLQEIQAVQAEYERLLSEPLASPLFEQLVEESEALTPLIQAFASPTSASIRVMIYCILKGAEIRRVHYAYELERRSHLTIDVELSDGRSLRFESEDLWDAEVLRHFGMTKRGGRPILEGYYAFRRG